MRWTWYLVYTVIRTCQIRAYKCKEGLRGQQAISEIRPYLSWHFCPGKRDGLMVTSRDDRIRHDFQPLLPLSTLICRILSVTLCIVNLCSPRSKRLSTTRARAQKKKDKKKCLKKDRCIKPAVRADVSRRPRPHIPPLAYLYRRA